MDPNDIDILHKTIKSLFDKPANQFTPGQTPILTGYAIYDSKEVNQILDSILNGWWALHEKAEEFERQLSLYQDNCTIPSVFTNSGSSANLLALNAIKVDRDLKEGEIITSACVFPTTFNPILQLGFIPFFVDIDKTLNPNPEEVNEAINSKTVGIIVAHTLGNPAKIEEIRDIAKKRGLFLIEDCCDALGSKYKGRKCGTFGEVSTFSFYPAHIITTGEGGAASTYSKSLEKILRSLRDWGKDCWCRSDEKNPNGSCRNRFNFKISGAEYDHRYIYSQIGYNLKPLEMQAAMGIEQLKRLDGFCKARKENFNFYQKNLSEIEEISLPEINDGADPVFFGLPIIINDNKTERSDLLKFLNTKKIGTRLVFAGNILSQPAYKDIKFSGNRELPYTNRIMKDCFWVGIHPGLTQEMKEYVVSTLKEYFRK